MAVDSRHLADARAALDGGDWRTAVESAQAALAEDESGDAYLVLATALWCGYEIDRSIVEMKAAYRHYIRESRPERAGWLASWIAIEELTTRGNPAVARGWLQRARRLLVDRPACAERGWFLLWEGAFESPERLAAAADEAMDIARTCGDRDLEIESLLVQGMMLVQAGRVDDGMVLLDEVMAAVTGGETATPLVVGDAFCLTLGACEQAGDFSRAEEWCRVGLRAADSRANGFLKASCLASYGWILTVLGRWREGEARLSEAVELYRVGHRQLQSHASIKLAELRRRQGRHAEAGRLLDDVPRSAGALRVRAELAFDAGDFAGTLALARELDALVQGFPVTEHVVALQLIVRAAAALGDIETAAGAFDELEKAASTISTDSACAAVWLARAALLGARGDAEACAAACAQAARLFTSARAPFEAARAMLAQADALRNGGHDDAATRLARQAREQLEKLGHPGSDRLLSRREREVLVLLAQGLSNSVIAQSLTLSPHTVHRHVANVLRKLDAPTRAGAVAQAGRLGLI
ncbi:MAG: LuxR C-terminal-related transcriptional regulator [Candidatus Dormibacteria bacterium]|jgi:DNA-binding NarL/FixJ family response regulator